MPLHLPLWATAKRAALGAAALSLHHARAAADTYLNRSGTLIHEDDLSHGDGVAWWALVALAALTFALYKGFQAKWPQHSDALNFNLAWLAALAIGAVGLALSK